MAGGSSLFQHRRVDTTAGTLASVALSQQVFKLVLSEITVSFLFLFLSLQWRDTAD